MALVVETVVRIVTYTAFIVGLYLAIVQPLLSHEFTRVKRKWRHNRQTRLTEQKKNKPKQQEQNKNPFVEHLTFLLISNGYKQATLPTFSLITFVMFAVSVTFIYMNVPDLLVAFGFGLAVGTIPYIWLRFTLARNRQKASYAFLIEFSHFQQVYQTSQRDIYQTIFQVSQETYDPYLKNVYQRLLSSMQISRSEGGLKEAIRLFAFSIKGAFAKRLGKLILKAYVDGSDITHGLEDLGSDIKKRKKDMQTERTGAINAIVSGYLPIFLLPIAVYVVWQMSSVIDLGTFFFQPVVFTVFVIACLLSLICFLLTIINAKPKASI